MDGPLSIALVLVYAYVLGSTNMSYLAGRLVKGIDLRKVGSGTVGASNVWYNVGRYWIFPIGVFDLFVKGMSPAIVARALDLDLGVQVVASLLSIVGHNWSVFLRFQGGRGVAPIVGSLIALGRLELAVFIVVTTAGWRSTKASGVWVLLAFACLPFLSLYWDRPIAVVWLMVGILAITTVKRLASNSLANTGVPLPQLLVNRLLFDRDIADHDAWVRRNSESQGA
jgi:glycerol-3-phosphate acyltransferase PlsY